ncbi:O-antigen ligase family protein [Lichenihabitans sp. Uapishka_5]|uniref:O-antigen ligase family protein n=1 Tax=Lichenihabitans sp. Uapishka_5 TaxID=3037302 RepID=UPI0029E7E48A|nr:O-antigen ligase family protein [Lichenihabitans sp. Uapishka_5]MDX7950392.1 O-antigen ligase family protein [Lichenihabitans sp. Uapishka_5]
MTTTRLSEAALPLRPLPYRAPTRGVARGLALAASVTLCFLLPVLMVIANKSAPVTLALGSVLANLAALAAGQGRPLLRRYRDTLLTGSGVLLLLVFVWSALSLGWSVSPAMTLRGLRETAPELLFGWGLAAAWPMVARRGDLRLIALGIVVSALLIASEGGTHMPLHRLVGARALAFDLKRSSIPPLLLLWPAVALVAQGRHWRMVLLLAIFAEIGACISHSSASIVAVVLGLAIYGLGRRAPLAATRVFGTAIVLCLLAAPWTGTLMTYAVPPRLERLLEDQHAKERIAIWTTFEQRVWERSWIGHGFDASFRLGDAADTSAERPGDGVIRDIHPHNQLLQVWIDFGLVGGIGVLVGLAWMMGRLSRLPPLDLAPRVAFLISATMMGLVGVQAWDAWWLASLAVCWGAFTVLRHHPAGSTAAVVAEPGP